MLRTFTYALEEDIPQADYMDLEAPAAAVLMMQAADTVWRACLNQRDLDGRGYGSDELWKGSPGFGEDRWAFWKMRFDGLSQWDELRGDTRDFTKQAVVIMGQFDGSEGRNMGRLLGYGSLE